MNATVSVVFMGYLRVYKASGVYDSLLVESSSPFVWVCLHEITQLVF